ncbi:MAG: DUF115 domain-containing protein [Deltaproteobacteria bacterium]|jgi:hypothetical protein|nr:DUF115 domain-containing protein [Deltaproteobacteria bacterium]
MAKGQEKNGVVMGEDLVTAMQSRILMDRAAAAAPKILQGPEGPGLMFRGTTIHNPDNPMAEANNWVGMALSQRRRQGQRPSMALVFGLGLGWHLRVIMDSFPGIMVHVLEPDKSLVDTYEKYNVLGPAQKPNIHLSQASLDEVLAREVVHGEGGAPIVLPVPGYRRLWPQEAGTFIKRVSEETSRREVIEKTKELTDSAFIENLAKNTGLSTRIPDLMLLKGRFPARPAFVVGAGPSLAKNGHLLAEAIGRSVIICAAAALKPLLGQGVRPDVIIVLESSDTSSYLRLSQAERDILGGQAVLAAASSSHPAHFEAEGYHKALFHLNGGEAQLLGRGLYLPQGGNAGTAAFALAYVWGLNPLVLVGQDQSYEGNFLHAPGTPDSVLEDKWGDTIVVPGVGGGTVETNTSLLASLGWYQEAAATIRRSPNGGPRLINSTARGASIRGFEEISLSETLRAMPADTPTIDIPALVEAIPRPSGKEIKDDLKQMSGLLSSLKRILQINPQKCLIEMMAVSQASAFMGQILAPAMAAGSKPGILKNLIWADGLILKMLANL